MKRIVCLTVLYLTALIAKAQTPDFTAVADKIVNKSLEIKPGEVVIIMGTEAEIELMGELYVSVAKAGGQPVLRLYLPKASKKAFMKMPEEYLGMTSTYDIFEARIADCYIYTSSVQDPELWSDVPEERAAIARKSQDPLRYAYSLSHNRVVSLGQAGGIPSKAYAESVDVSYDELISMFWKSVGTDFDKMLTSGKQISSLLKPESVLKLTTKEGTNLSFKISKNEPVLNTGRTKDTKIDIGPTATYLPAGEVYIPIDLTSAEGTLVVPRFDFRGNWVENLKLKFARGSIVSVEADKNGELIKEFFNKQPESTKSLSVFDLGLNPDSHPLGGSKFISYEMAGMICLFVGDNSWAGGDISTGAMLNFFQPDATLTVNGKPLVKNGKLSLTE